MNGEHKNISDEEMVSAIDGWFARVREYLTKEESVSSELYAQVLEMSQIRARYLF